VIPRAAPDIEERCCSGIDRCGGPSDQLQPEWGIDGRGLPRRKGRSLPAKAGWLSTISSKSNP